MIYRTHIVPFGPNRPSAISFVELGLERAHLEVRGIHLEAGMFRLDRSRHDDE